MSDTGSPGEQSQYLFKDKLPVYRDSSESFILMSAFCPEQGCSGGGERCWTHQWLTCVERRTWPAGGPEETVSSWSTNGSWRKWSSCMRWVLKKPVSGAILKMKFKKLFNLPTVSLSNILLRENVHFKTFLLPNET